MSDRERIKHALIATVNNKDAIILNGDAIRFYHIKAAGMVRGPFVIHCKSARDLEKHSNDIDPYLGYVLRNNTNIQLMYMNGIAEGGNKNKKLDKTVLTARTQML